MTESYIVVPASDQPQPSIVNLVRNPSFEVSTTDWADAPIGLTRTTTGGGVSGAAYGRTVAPFDDLAGIIITVGALAFGGATTGDIVTVSGYVRSSLSGGTVSISLLTGDQTIVVTSTPIPWPTDWLQISVTGALIPSILAGVRIRLDYGGTGVLSGQTFDFDAFMATLTQNPVSYFDGDTPADGVYTYAWTGTAHASSSTATPV